MMRFLADMGVSQGVVKWLSEQGHDVVHLRDEGLQQLPNGEIYAKAGREQRGILTFDLDFGEIVALCGGQVMSVVMFRLNNTRTPFVIQRPEAALSAAEAALRQGAILVVEDGRHRVRRLPLGA
jgi:predicted nuclease of predicted toxin-antitoxin system